MKIVKLILLIIVFISIKGYTQSITENTSYPTSTQVQCEYKFNGGGGINFDTWVPPSNCIAVNNNITGVYLYLKWKNIEASAGKSSLVARYHDKQLYTHDVYASVGPFNLSFSNPTFVGGATKNIPCYSTDPVTISLNPYINTANNGIDKDLEITSHFRWTLPSGWQSTSGKTGTFDAYSSITVIPPVSSSTATILVQPYADAGQGRQYGPNVSLQITRNLDPFSITGSSNVVYNSVNTYSVPSGPGVSYTWQLPMGWSGSSTTNSINVTAGCGSGNIIATMFGCNGSKTSQISIPTPSIIAPGTVISGPTTFSHSSESFSVNGVPSGCSVNWTCSSNISFDNQPGSSKTFTINSPGAATIQATVSSTACGTSVVLPIRSFAWVGIPVITGISGPSNPSLNQPASYTAQLSLVSNPDSYYWTTSPTSGASISTDGRYASILFTNSGGYQVVARAHNSLGWSDYAINWVNVPDGYYLAISPNPATGEATIELKNTSKEIVVENLEWEFDVYDQQQSMKEKKTKFKEKLTKLNVTNWKDGVYFVRAKIGKDVLTEKLVVKH